MNSNKIGPWVVLNCAVTQVLGHYDTELSAQAAAIDFGNASFAYKLSETEMQAMKIA